MRPRMRSRTWRQYAARDRAIIEGELEEGGPVGCPHCGFPLEARPSTRLAAVLPRGVEGIDLDCRPCRRFHPRVRHSDRSLYLLRLRRLAAAVLRA